MTAPLYARRRRRALLLALLALVGLIGGVALGWAKWGPSAPSTGPTAGGTTAPTPAPPAPATTTAEPSPTPAPAADVTFTIGAVGDVLPHDTPIKEARTADGYDFTPMLEPTRAWSEGVDLAICNMEVPLAMPGEQPSGYPLFGAPAQIVGNLAALGWNGCATATNHTLDRGADNAMYTLDVFDENHLGHAGSARSQAEEERPQLYTLTRDGRTITVAQLGATYGTNGLPIPADRPWVIDLIDTDRIIAQATAARAAGADLVVVSLHWGVEYQLTQNAEQEKVATALADSGAVDLIIGNHPHVPQPMAKLPGGPDGSGMWVAYSLGNFISNQDSNCCIPETGTGVFMTATVTAPAQGPARVTGMSWTPMTVDRLGGQRVYPLADLVGGERPAGLSLSAGTLADRMSRVQAIMSRSEGADFPMLATPPQRTGDKAVVIPRAG